MDEIGTELPLCTGRAWVLQISNREASTASLTSFVVFKGWAELWFECWLPPPVSVLKLDAQFDDIKRLEDNWVMSGTFMSGINPLLRKLCLGLGDGSLNKVLALQPGRLKFSSLAPM